MSRLLSFFFSALSGVALVAACGGGSDPVVDPGNGNGFGADSGVDEPTDSGGGGIIFNPGNPGQDGGGGGLGFDCVPNTCEELNVNCGQQADGCGDVIDCGSCTPPEICGGSGVASQCGGTTGCIPQTCDDVGADCGPVGDGCGDVVECGDCTAPEFCGGGGPSVCGGEIGGPDPNCTPETCNSLNANCGPVANGCGELIDDCGTCNDPHICGGGGVNICGGGNGVLGCIPQTCDDLGLNCGPASDGCGGVTDDCGTCADPHVCGGGGLPNICGGGNGDPNCIPQTCDDLGKDCGPVSDGCGGLTDDCGTCGVGELCGADGVPNVCGTGDNQPCTNFCLQQQACEAGAPTELTGTVFAPNGTLPLPEALVYVPNEDTAFPYGLEPFVDGVAGGVCEQCSTIVSGAPLISTIAGVDGTFTLTNVPSGSNIPLVIQLGRWRRLITIPNVPACTSTALTAAQTRLPTRQAEGNAMDSIPLMAIATGDVDALECVISKLGVEDSEFTNPGDGGRINFYQDNGAVIDNNTPGYDTLFGTQAELDKYDALIFACRGNDHDVADADQQRILDVAANTDAYVNKGGRAYFTHFSYSWLYDVAPSDALPWPGTTSADVNDQSYNVDVVGEINTTFPKGQTFATWLDLPAVNALTATNPPRIAVEEARRNMDSPITNLPAQSWINIYNDNPDPATLHLTFNTPWDVPAEEQCGRVLFSSFHVTSTAGSNDETFPDECNNNPMTPQEKVLAFMLFDLTSCIQPFDPSCDTLSCVDQGITCGLAGDGCGGAQNCGACPPPADCVPLDCADQNIDCGLVGDGCGDVVDCGPCDPPVCEPLSCADQNIDCGPAGDGCGEIIDCGSCDCTPLTCQDQNINCGPAGDGCGELLDCGDCPPGETCGGAGVPNECGEPDCEAETCDGANAECGYLADGCGELLDCGECAAGQTCGGAGVDNQCASIQ